MAADRPPMRGEIAKETGEGHPDGGPDPDPQELADFAEPFREIHAGGVQTAVVAAGGMCAPSYDLFRILIDREDPDPPRWWQKAFWTGSPVEALADVLAAERHRDMHNYDLYPKVRDLFPTVSAPRGGITYSVPDRLDED